MIDRFCGNCGNEISDEAEKPHEDAFTILTPSLLYYFITLALLVIYKLTPVFGNDFEGFLYVSVIDVLIVVCFTIYSYKDLKHLFSLQGFRLSIAGLTILGALAGSIFISWFANIINIVIDQHGKHELNGNKSDQLFPVKVFPLPAPVTYGKQQERQVHKPEGKV